MVMRDCSIELTPADKAAAHKVLTKGLQGVDEKHHRRWLRVLKGWFELEPGEITLIDTRHPRSGPFHRFHMLVEQTVFNAQSKFEDFEQFRNWLKIQVGHVEWVPGAKGGIVPLPKSISYADMEEAEMREFHDKMMEAFYGPHIAPFLWKHLGPAGAAEMIRTVLLEFEP